MPVTTLQPIINNESLPQESILLLSGVLNVMADTAQGAEQSITVQHSDKAGFGPPPHSHPWSETFYVISGSVNFMLNGAECACTAGGMVYIPPNQVHAFQSGDEGVKMIEFTSPDSKALELFRSLSAFLDTGSLDDLVSIREVFAKSGATLRI